MQEYVVQIDHGGAMIDLRGLRTYAQIRAYLNIMEVHGDQNRRMFKGSITEYLWPSCEEHGDASDCARDI